ncbi:hypothetical protein C5167_036365 [Papaver somniferum]|uniref:Uncharacterized protein n=1 Tax=Papaver somniferum TaxID=3469 RepID=A0A4Y7I7E0_PAPSO|nr:hypothetical protein C5167_036365 [Papaver somniferum]
MQSVSKSQYGTRNNRILNPRRRNSVDSGEFITTATVRSQPQNSQVAASSQSLVVRPAIVPVPLIGLDRPRSTLCMVGH